MSFDTTQPNQGQALEDGGNLATGTAAELSSNELLQLILTELRILNIMMAQGFSLKADDVAALRNDTSLQQTSFQT